MKDDHELSKLGLVLEQVQFFGYRVFKQILNRIRID